MLSFKFYFFDLAPVIYFTRRGEVLPGSELFGRVFEQGVFILDKINLRVKNEDLTPEAFNRRTDV